MSAPALLLLAVVALLLVFAATYLLARRIDNYGIVDIAWSYAFGALAAFALAATGWPARRALLAAMSCSGACTRHAPRAPRRPSPPNDRPLRPTPRSLFVLFAFSAVNFQ